MKIARTVLLPMTMTALGLASMLSPAFGEEQWYFYVTNNTGATLTELVASQGDQSGSFDLNGGIPTGKTVKILWAQHTNDLPCKALLKAHFDDGSDSKSAEFDFCKNLDDPIVFSKSNN